MAETNKELWSTAIDAFETGAPAVLELVCRRLLERDPDNFPVRMLLAHALFKMKRFADARELLEGANPDDERTLVLWHRTAGDFYAERGDYEAAEDEYSTALTLADGPLSDLVLDLVEARLAQGHNAEALQAIETFMGGTADRGGSGDARIDDRELLAYARARALRNLGRFEDALAAAREAVGLGGEAAFEAGDALVAELEQRLALEASIDSTDAGLGEPG